MSNEADDYQQTHSLLDAARTAVAGGETKKALLLIIDAVEATVGWEASSHPDDPDHEPALRSPDLDDAEQAASRLPDLRTIMIQGRNCVSVLNEHGQKHDLVHPSYEFAGAGPFLCKCSFMGRTVSSDSRRTKMESKHDAAERMLTELRGNRDE